MKSESAAELIPPMSDNNPHHINWYNLCDLSGFGNALEDIELQSFPTLLFFSNERFVSILHVVSTCQ